MMTHMSVETNIRVYKVTDRGHRTWTVTNNAEDDLYECGVSMQAVSEVWDPVSSHIFCFQEQ